MSKRQLVQLLAELLPAALFTHLRRASHCAATIIIRLSARLRRRPTVAFLQTFTARACIARP